LSEKKQKSIEELIANSSIGHAMKDIKTRGIDAHLIDLEAEMTPARFRNKKRSAVATKLKAEHGNGSRIEPPKKPPYGVSKITVGGKMSFIGANRRMAPVFSKWWEGLLRWMPEGDPPPNIEAAHKAYMSGSSVNHYSSELDVMRSKLDPHDVLHDRVNLKAGWYIKDVITTVRQHPAHRLVTHRQQNEVSLSCGVGSAVRDRIMKENEAIGRELERRRQLDADSLVREAGAVRELERRQRSQHTCTKNMSSMNCHACNAGVPYPHQPVDEIMQRGAAMKKLSVLVDIVRRLESEMGRLRIELDRLARID